MATLCLNMIVKNEGKNLKRCLQNVKKYIDYYVICDTGSSDNTKEVIKQELKDIPGEILDHEWKNFEHNRNLALRAAEGKADYLIICDADEVLTFSKTFDKNKLTHDSYAVRYANGTLDYSFIAIVKNGLDWRYVGVTHEYIASDKAKSRAELKEIKIIDYGDGGSKQNKFERDIELLTQGLKEEPENPRYMFYLANSYKDLGRPAEAIPWYQARINDGSWVEEVTCSYEYMGKCYKAMGDIDNAIQTWLKGYEYNPHRAECIYHAAETYMETRKFKEAYELLNKAKEIPYPKNDILFINRYIYNYLVDYQLTICTFYVDQTRDIRHIFTKLLSEPMANRQNVLSNYKFYVKNIEDCVQQTIYFPPEVKVGGYNNSTPCIIKANDEYLVNIRNTTYILYPDGSFNNPKGKCNTINSYIKYDKNFNILESKVFEDPDLNINYANGIDDIRLYIEDGKVKFIGTKVYSWSNELVYITMVYGDYDISKEYLDYKKIEPVVSPSYYNGQMNICEKNWVPFDHHGQTKFIYQWNPIKIGVLKEHKDDIILDIVQENSEGLFNGRGSTPGIKVGDELWFLIHVVDYQEGIKRKYYHQLVVLDYNSLRLKRKSNLFNFVGDDYEYCLGMVVEDDRIIITHNVHESTSYIKIYNRQAFLAKIFANLGI